MIQKNKRFVFVVDDFLPIPILQHLQELALQQNYESYINDTGHYGFGVEIQKEVLEKDQIVEKIYKDFNLSSKIKIANGRIHMRHNHEKINHHFDEGSYSFLLYLKGEPLLHNGTGFLTTDGYLTTSAGFLENRAVFFNAGLIRHTNMQALGESSPRYSLNIFFDYEK
tara:strand:+ start:674 stop:1177 length:504 start_codon:yes stop_codon:yes gene_type:complete